MARELQRVRPAEEDAEAAVNGHAVIERVRRESEAIADREVSEALRRLEARGDLTEGQREAVREMADGIVETLVAAPARTMAAAEAADEEALQTVVDLFDPDQA